MKVSFKTFADAEVGDSLLIVAGTSPTTGSLGCHPRLSFPARGVVSFSVKGDVVPGTNGVTNATRHSSPRLKTPLEICHCLGKDEAWEVCSSQ